MIEVKAVFFRYQKDWVLNNISFQVKKGEFLGIIGPNGSGKTTLLKILYRLLSPECGEVLLESRSLQKMDRIEISKKIGVVAQETHILFPFRVIEVVLMGRNPYMRHLIFETKKDLEIAKRAMELTEISSLSDRFIDELSGGERKRVFIARALTQEPEIILLDEPTANLDMHHQIDFLNLIQSLNKEKGLTIIMATHDINISSEFCNRIILLQNGNIFKMGTPSEVITQENIEKVYGCKVLVDKNPFSGMPHIHPYLKI